jgi:hypothetical protein
MVEALLLDFLIVVAILLLVPLGALRGGMREVCSAAGLLLGILIGEQWAQRWGSWIAETFTTSATGSAFVVAAVTAILIMIVVGYGASSAFNYHPGPGGRMYGAVIAAINGTVLAGYLINGVALYINDGSYPDVVKDGWVSRGLSAGFDWVILGAAVLVVLLSLLGAVVREREPADQVWAQTPGGPTVVVRRPSKTQSPVTGESEKIEPVGMDPAHEPVQGEQYAPVKIREVRHWEEDQTQAAPDTITGWQKTWPKSATGERILPPWENADDPKPPPNAFRKVPPAHIPQSGDQSETLKRWIASDEDDSSVGPRNR